jgi:hypothetical protein
MKWVEGHAMPDHIQMCSIIPPKFSAAHTLVFFESEIGGPYPSAVSAAAKKRHASAALSAHLFGLQ